MDSGSGSTVGGRDPAWKYCTPFEGNINGTIYNYCGMMIKSSGITRFKFHLSYTNPHSSSKKCPNVPLEVKKKKKKELLVQRNKIKPKKAVDIEEIQAELRGTIGGSHRRLVDDNNDDDEEEEEEDDDVYMYLADKNPNERADYRVACRASKASEWNRQQEEGFMRGKRKFGKSFNLNSFL